MSDTTTPKPPPASGAGPAAGTSLPAWAQEMRSLFRSGSVAQFILHGNVFDVVPFENRLLSLKTFLDEVMFSGYDAVLQYDRSRGIRATRGNDDWTTWLRQALGDSFSLAQTREPGAALELLDRYLLRTLNLQAITEARRAATPPAAPAPAAPPIPPSPAEPGTFFGNVPPSGSSSDVAEGLPGVGRSAASPASAGAAASTGAKVPRKIAMIVDFAEFVVPQGDPIQLGGAFSANIVKVLGWANDPAILQSNIVTVLLVEGLHDLNGLVVDNPHAAAIRLPLPNEAEMTTHMETLAKTQFPDLAAQSDVPVATLGQRLTGLSRIGARTVISLALRNGQRLTAKWLTGTKKDLIERECQGLLEFIEPRWGLDTVVGHEAAKARLCLLYTSPSPRD